MNQLIVPKILRPRTYTIKGPKSYLLSEMDINRYPKKELRFAAGAPSVPPPNGGGDDISPYKKPLTQAMLDFIERVIGKSNNIAKSSNTDMYMNNYNKYLN